MRGVLQKEPPPDIEFPYFKVIYYDQPESVGIEFKTTDGRSERWPDREKGFHGDGSINIWQYSDEEVQHDWRQKLGELLIGRFLLAEDNLSAHFQLVKGRRWFLNDLPTGYKLFTQTKDGRSDHYLIGSRHATAFRSPREFFPHARWLMMGSDMNSEGKPDCLCKYCDRSRTQKEIDRYFNLPTNKDSGHKSSGSHSGRHGGTSAAATSEIIISQAKDYRNLKKPTAGVQQTASKGVESIDPALL